MRVCTYVCTVCTGRAEGGRSKRPGEKDLRNASRVYIYIYVELVKGSRG